MGPQKNKVMIKSEIKKKHWFAICIQPKTWLEHPRYMFTTEKQTPPPQRKALEVRQEKKRKKSDKKFVKVSVS